MSLTIAVFTHSLVSDWNHGNAHFLRGVLSELQGRGHRVNVFEPENAWSKSNLVADYGVGAIREFEQHYSALRSSMYQPDQLEIERWLEGVDLALVHEWNEPNLVAAIGRYRRRNLSIRVLFHDTHHRAVTAPQELERFELSEYDGVLAYGRSLQLAYQNLGWGRQVYVWHEAADTRVFHPLPDVAKDSDLVWIGNWGDDERTEELREFFFGPCTRLGLKAEAYGVRYPTHALAELAKAGVSYRGWLSNFKVPAIFARNRMTIHVPRRPYTRQLPGIPTIRPFEALACGTPLICSPWDDEEHLFRPGTDFLIASNGGEMEAHMNAILKEPAVGESLARSGLETIRTRHTCAHRVDELMKIYRAICPATAHSAQEQHGLHEVHA